MCTLNFLDKATGPIRYGLSNDYMFRAVLQMSNDALKHLLSALLDIPFEDIRTCKILNPIILGNAIDDKTCILDVLVCLNNDRLINLEMQMSHYRNWPNRALFYLCRLFCNIRRGENYDHIMPAMHIGILNASPFEDIQEFYSEYLLREEKNNHIFTGNFSLRVLDLSQTETVSEEMRATDLYAWARLIRATTWEEVRELAETNDSIKEAVSYLQILSEDEEIQLQCEARERYEWDMNTMRHEGYEDGLAAGRAEAQERYEDGLAAGRAEAQERYEDGLAAGRAEAQERYEDGLATGRAEARERYEDGLAAGRVEGIATGRLEKQRINQLNNRLIADNRMADLQRSTADEDYQMQLMREYGILPGDAAAE